MNQQSKAFGLNLPAMILATAAATGLTHEQRKAKFRAYCEQISGVEGQFPSTFIPPNDRPAVKEAVQKVATTLKVAGTQYVRDVWIALDKMPAEPPKASNGVDTGDGDDKATPAQVIAGGETDKVQPGTGAPAVQ